MNEYIENVIKTVERRDSAKPEYIQCVKEVFRSLEKVAEAMMEQGIYYQFFIFFLSLNTARFYIVRYSLFIIITLSEKCVICVDIA